MTELSLKKQTEISETLSSLVIKAQLVTQVRKFLSDATAYDFNQYHLAI